MKVCEVCIGHGWTPVTSHNRKLQVLCGCCLGTGMLCLGHESESRYREMRELAIQRAVREGWHEVQWVGEPGQARKVYVPCGATTEKVSA